MIRYSVRTLFIITGFVALLCGVAGIMFRTTYGDRLTAKQANLRLWNCLVPEDATDVWFETSSRATQVECSIDEASFQKWAAKMKWRLLTIDPAEPIHVYSRKGGLVTVGYGLHFDEFNG